MGCGLALRNTNDRWCIRLPIILTRRAAYVARKRRIFNFCIFYRNWYMFKRLIIEVSFLTEMETLECFVAWGPTSAHNWPWSKNRSFSREWFYVTSGYVSVVVCIFIMTKHYSRSIVSSFSTNDKASLSTWRRRCVLSVVWERVMAFGNLWRTRQHGKSCLKTLSSFSPGSNRTSSSAFGSILRQKVVVREEEEEGMMIDFVVDGFCVPSCVADWLIANVDE